MQIYGIRDKSHPLPNPLPPDGRGGRLSWAKPTLRLSHKPTQQLPLRVSPTLDAFDGVAWALPANPAVFFRYFVMFLFCRTKQPIHQPPSFPRRRESRLQKAAAIFKDFHNFQNLDSRLRGNDEAGIFHLHLLKRPSEKPKTGFSAGLFVFDSNPTSKYSRYALPAHGCGGRGLRGRSRI